MATPQTNVGGSVGGFDFTSLLTNPLLWQIALGTSTSLNPNLEGLNKGLLGVIGARSQAKLAEKYSNKFDPMNILRGLLSGGAVPLGVKIAANEKGMKLDIDKNALSSIGGGQGQGQGQGQQQSVSGDMQSSGLDWNRPSNQTDLIKQMMDATNPFPSGQVDNIPSYTELAGLGPEDVNAALKGALGVGGLKEQTINDIAERMYKGQLGKWYEAQTAAVGAPGPLDKPYIIPVNGRQVTVREWNALPEESQKYYMYVFGQELKGKDSMSPREWKMTEPTDRERLLRGIQEDKSLLKTEQDLARARHIEPPEPKPSPVTWTTATNEVTKRFGRLDPTGMWAVTPELQSAHRKAQEFLAESQSTGIDPLRAVNDAENRARNWITDREQRYIEYIEDAQKIKKSSDRKLRISKIQSEFFKQFGYIPSIRR